MLKLKAEHRISFEGNTCLLLQSVVQLLRSFVSLSARQSKFLPRPGQTTVHRCHDGEKLTELQWTSEQTQLRRSRK